MHSPFPALCGVQNPNTLIIPGLLLKESRKAAIGHVDSHQERDWVCTTECNDCGGNLLPPSVVVFKTAAGFDVEQKCLCFRAALARSPASPRTLFASFLPSFGKRRRKIRFSLLDASRVREGGRATTRRSCYDGRGIELITTRLPPAAVDAWPG